MDSASPVNLKDPPKRVSSDKVPTPVSQNSIKSMTQIQKPVA
jgi:hypothetical protein